jgi:phospholipase C
MSDSSSCSSGSGKKRAGFALFSFILAALLISCRGVGDQPPTPPPPTVTGINQVNHIIIMAQENRGFDEYFGAMRQYWAQNGYADQSFDGLAQFNPTTGAAPLQAAAPSNQGCDPAVQPPANCQVDAASPSVASFHMISKCEENPSPSWNESHVDFNRTAPTSSTFMGDGFVQTAAHDARANSFFDVNGNRAMGYYDGTDLPYYYFMATNFATSDRWFSPVMSRTQPNRLYMLAATSAGHVYPPKAGTPALSNPTIFDSLQAAGITWKVYVSDLNKAKTPHQDSALNFFQTAAKYPANIVGIDQYQKDLDGGTLPSVAYIEPAYDAGLDEHPGVDDNIPGANIQLGAQYVASLINALMKSTSWKDSVFILTFDEFGGFYDHVSPQTMPNPDGVAPNDLLPGPPPNGPDICVGNTDPICNFGFTGYRVPLVVVSPFSKKNYVSHTIADYTAWLKFVETRFGLSPLTQRDAVQMDMTEFFDFDNVPWATPPSPPPQPVDGPCYMDHLP